MTVIPNFLRNSEDILCLVESHQHLFQARDGADAHTSIVPNLYSRFSTLKDKDMSKELIEAIFADNDLDEFVKDSYNFIQIQRYLPGDSITIHKDVYSITNLHLIMLTNSDCDGLVVENPQTKNWDKIYDKAGNYIKDLGDLWHFVAPVKNTRYSLVIAE